MKKKNIYYLDLKIKFKKYLKGFIIEYLGLFLEKNKKENKYKN
jgi:hypothetical protein